MRALTSDSVTGAKVDKIDVDDLSNRKGFKGLDKLLALTAPHSLFTLSMKKFDYVSAVTRCLLQVPLLAPCNKDFMTRYR